MCTAYHFAGKARLRSGSLLIVSSTFSAAAHTVCGFMNIVSRLTMAERSSTIRFNTRLPAELCCANFLSIVISIRFSTTGESVLKSTSHEPTERVRLGISSCLLGEAVRFDGGHKRDAFLTDVFGKYVEWVPVCPEF